MLRQAEEFALLNELSQARKRSDQVLSLIPHDLLYERPIRERHRLLFYIGHLEAFDANLLLRKGDTPEAVRSITRKGRTSDLHKLFAFGIDPVDGDLPSDKREDWPAIEEVRDYVRKTRQQLGRHLRSKAGRQIEGVPMSTLMHVAIEHRLMHVETLAYLLNRLPIEKPVRAVAATQRQFSDEDILMIPAGIATLGAEQDEHPYIWDNEYRCHQVEVPAFEVDRYMVTNGQFLRFVEDGGYTNRHWWSDENWRWREAQHILHPSSWQVVEGEWCLNSLFDLVPFQSDWPVYVSHAEAQAYANWIGKELPTEAQWHRAAYGSPYDVERPYPWGGEAPTRDHGNFNFKQWDPEPVDAHPIGASAFGVVGLLGNGWEWTSTPFAPFEEFSAYPFYPGYSANFFDGKHYVMKGGSAHTAERLLRRSFRNWFQPHYPYVCAGFRCVSN